jgi:transcriptional regulator with XRE-family HTH domain
MRSTGGMATATAGDTLRAWRERRRLSQLELALRAGTTQRHVSFVEQGRSQPGRALLLRLAESLDLSPRARNQLLLSAGLAPVFPDTPYDDASLGALRAAVDRVLTGHLPFPALVIDRNAEIVASNAAVDVLWEGADPALLEPPIQSLRLALHPRGMAPRIANFGQWGRHITENLRHRLDREPDVDGEALLDELEGYLAGHPVDPDEAPLGFAVPLRLRTGEGELRLITTLASFATAAHVTVSELRLEAFLPADEATAAILAARHRATGSPRDGRAVSSRG